MDKEIVPARYSLLTPKVIEHQGSQSQFERKKAIGSGAYGNVELVEKNGVEYALKVMQKRKLEKRNQQHLALIEKELLNSMDHPGVIKLVSSFQDRAKLYFCLEYCEGGDLMKFIQKYSSFMSPDLKVFYVAEIVSILSYLQKINLTHRDIKPENILITKSRHLKLADFATADISKCEILSQQFKDKILNRKLKNGSAEGSFLLQENSKGKRQYLTPVKSSEISDAPTLEIDSENIQMNSKLRKGTFVGTSYYVSPEMLQNDECSFSSDLWALGCIVYQLYYNELPFDGSSQYEIFQKILKGDLKLPKNKKVQPLATDLIKRLLKKDPSERLGCGSRQEMSLGSLKKHPFFDQKIDFDLIFQAEVPPLLPQKPEDLEGETLLSYHIKRLRDDNSVLIQGFVEKRTFICYHYYYLAVFKDLRAVRIKQEDPKKYVHLEIDYKNDEFPASSLDSESFWLFASGKKYKLKCEQPQKWIETINERCSQIRIQASLDKGPQQLESSSAETCPEGFSFTP